MADSVLTSWVHGISMQAEYPNRLTSVRHIGPFARIEGSASQNTWFHFPIPTPAVSGGEKLRAGAVLRDLVKVNIERRRRAEATEEWRKRYAIRAGIEGTNSELKRAHGLGRLRVRGGRRVRLAVYLKALACNFKLNFRTRSSEAWAYEVVLYDGASTMAEYRDLHLDGDHPAERFDIPGHPEVQTALNITVGVQFAANPSNVSSMTMEFIAAGCEFIQ